MPTCLSLSALKSLVRRLEIVINSQQVPLAPLTEWHLHLVSTPDPSRAPPAPTDTVGCMVSSQGQRQFLLCTSQRRGAASDTLHTMVALLKKLVASFKGLWSQRSSQLQPSHMEGLAAIRRGFLLMCRTLLWSEIDFQPPILCFAHRATREGTYRCKLSSTSLGHELGQLS